MTRGILSIYWGDESKLPIDRLTKSLNKFHSNLKHELIKIDAPTDDVKSLQQKANMFDLSPFDETLFLDIDTIVLGNLDYGFEKAQKNGLAICICEAPWAKRYKSIFTGDQVEYNTGVIFFSKKAKVVFDEWKNLSNKVDTSIVGVNAGNLYTMPSNDQGSFALAIEKTEFNPYVLPLNWNFRPQWQKSFWGPIKIWHDYSDPPDVFYDLSDYYQNKESVIQYHFMK